MILYARLGATALLLVALAACSSAGHGGGHSKPPPSIEPGGLYLASSFEQPVCGNYHHPGSGCEFGIQGGVRTGAFGCRTGPGCLAEERAGLTHMGALRNVAVAGGHAFVGCAFKVPTLPAAQKAFIELMQLSPGDGSQPLNPIEVRMYTSGRTLSLGQFKGPDEPRTTWAAPVDQWFYVVVEMQYGTNVVNRMWVYGPDDTQVAQLEVPLTTAGGRGKDKPRQKIGGVTNTLSPVTTYADDWYIATKNLGPLHIGPTGQPISG